MEQFMEQLSDWQTQVTLMMSQENTFWAWMTITIAAVVTTVLIKGLIRLLSNTLKHFLKNTPPVWDGVVVDLLKGLRAWVFFVWVFYSLEKLFRPAESNRKLFLVIVAFATIYQIGIWGFQLIRHWRHVVLEKKIKKDPSSATILGLLYTLIQGLFLTIIILTGLGSLGVDITALIAGLGVGGIAVALAAQNVLGDLLASLSIALDKPFIVGDAIATGQESGTVESIGLKTTQIRSISGELLVISNKDLLESRIQNYKRMQERRVVVGFGVTYNTSAETLEKIPTWTKEYVEAQKLTRFDRCHFAKYGPSSLDFELVFYILRPEYGIFMDIKEKILLDLFRRFAAEKIDFAFPTQTIYLENGNQEIPPSIKPSSEMAKRDF